MTSSWTIGKKLYAGLGALLGLLALACGAALLIGWSMKGQLDTSNQVTAKKLDLAAQVRKSAVMMRGDQRQILLSGFGTDRKLFDSTKAAIDGSAAEMTHSLNQITGLLKTDAGKKLTGDMERRVQDWLATNREVEDLVASGKVMDAWSHAKDKSNPIIDQLCDDAEALVQQQHDFLAASVEDTDARYSTVILTAVLLIVASAALGAVVSWTVRQTTRRLRDTALQMSEGAQQVVAAAAQVATSSQSLSQGATEQAASLEETSASMEEMSSMTRKNAENTGSAATLMNEVDARVAESNRSLSEMVTSMSAIQESSQKVAKIIKTIDEIAFQTNILALNAAVEAARAGEAGMGFAVVADEVRNLAQRSAQAAKDTAGLIEESISRAQGGALKVEQVATSISAITESVVKVKGLVDEVSLASRQQAQGFDQVAQAIAQMEKVTQTTAATAEESAAASEELNAQAETSMEVVRELESMVGGVTQGAVRHPAALAHVSRHASIVKYRESRPAKPPVVSAAAAEKAIPLGDTGTYGKF